MKVEPFVSFPGEKVVIEFDARINSVEMYAYYNYDSFEECKNFDCPLFENNSLKDYDKKKFVLNILGNAKPGFYAVKVFEEDSNEFYYSSIIVRPDYRLLIAFGLILLVGLFFVVKKNVFGKQ